jgi:hypothetical protein
MGITQGDNYESEKFSFIVSDQLPGGLEKPTAALRSDNCQVAWIGSGIFRYPNHSVIQNGMVTNYDSGDRFTIVCALGYRFT